MCVLLITRLLRLVGRFNHTSRVAVVTQTDLPKSVRNRCVVEVFGGVFVLSRCFLDFSIGVGAFAIGLSQISSFFFFYIYIARLCHIGHGFRKFFSYIIELRKKNMR